MITTERITGLVKIILAEVLIFIGLLTWIISRAV